MAGAPKENTNAEKWTIEDAEAFCDNVLSYIQKNTKCRSLSEAAVECGEYEELISYLCNKFGIVFKSIKKAKDIVKNRLVNQGLDGDANPTMAIFILKNNHDMKDRVDHTTDNKAIKNNESIKVEFVDFSEDED